jgi:hypothetical protein
MGLLFLDFDGVLNDDAWFAALQTRAMSDAEMMLANRADHLDPSKVSLVNEIVNATRATVIVSSTWRLAYAIEELHALLRSRGATFAVDGVTPRVTEYDPSRPLRAREILAYLAALPTMPVFAALDDDDLGGLVTGHVRIDGRIGLTRSDAEQAMRLLQAK